MKQFLLEEIKAFTTHLFLQPTFDTFLLREAVFKTASTVTFDGAANAEYYDTDATVPEHVTWGSLRPLAFQVIKGNRLPVSFQIILYPDDADCVKWIGPDATDMKNNCKATRFYLNLSYKNRLLTCTTGASYSEFSLDKSAEEAWDRAVQSMFRELKIASIEAGSKP